VIRNILWVTLHHGLGRAAVFVFFLALPRIVGIEATGRFTFWYTVLLMVLQPILDFSLNMVVVKHTAHGDLALVRRAVRFAAWVLPLASLGLYLAARVAGWQADLVGLLLVSFGLSLSLNLVFSYFRGREELQIEGVVGGVSKLLGPFLLFGFAALGVAGPTPGSRLPALVLIAVGVAGWALLVSLYPGRVRGLVKAVRAAGTAERSGFSLLREGLALGAVGLIGVLYLRIDVVMLGALVSDTEVGLYFTAAKIVETVFIVPHILMLVVFPRLVKTADPAPMMRRFAWLLGGLSLLATAVVAALGVWVVPAVYGDALSRISTLVLALAPAVLPVYLGFLFTQGLIVRDLQNRYLVIAAAGLVVNILLNAVLIPLYQGVGAAGATVATETLIAAAAAAALRRADAAAPLEPS
jgi:O-antigen/teichoic acid export membrane protein